MTNGQTTDDAEFAAFIAETDAEEETADRETLIAMLALYVDARDARDLYGKDVARLAGPIRKYLELHPGEELVDGEHDIVAWLQDKASSEPRPCDLNAMYDGSLPLFLQLLRNGCLRVDEKAIKSAGALVAGVERYMGPKGRTFSLQVVRK